MEEKKEKLTITEELALKLKCCNTVFALETEADQKEAYFNLGELLNTIDSSSLSKRDRIVLDGVIKSLKAFKEEEE